MFLVPNVFSSNLENKNSICSLVIKRHYGGKSISPIKKPKDLVSLKDPSLVNKTSVNPLGKFGLAKIKSQGLGNNNSTASASKDSMKTFYEHHAIKPTISPYKVAPKKVIDEVSPLSKPSLQEQFFNKFGFRSFRELLFGPSQVNYDNLVNSEVLKNNSNMRFPKGELLVVAPSVPPSPYCPPDLDKLFYFKAHLVAAVVFANKCEMPHELNFVIATYYKENVGQNIQLLQAIAKGTVLNKPMNLLSLLPPNKAQALLGDNLDLLKNMHLTQLGFFHEIKSCMQLNACFSVPFTMNKETLLHGKKNLLGIPVHNLTNQENPDYARVIKKSDGSDIVETYDLKSSVLPLKRLNHVRFVSDNEEEILLAVHDQTFKYVSSWQKNNPSTDADTVYSLLDTLQVIKQQFQRSGNIESFRCSYNAIRDQFAQFFIDHEIPMTLIVSFDQKDFSIDISDLSFFDQAFKEYYYSPKTPVLKLYQEYLAINNNNIKDTTQFFKYLAKRLLESSDF